VLNDQKNYRDFFENSADAMLIIENSRFVECNSAAVTMLGYNCKEELANASPFNLSPELQPDGRCSREKSIEMMQFALEQGNHRFEWNHIRQDGTDLQVEVSLTRVETDDGFQFFCVWHDITEHKQVEAAMVESEEIYKTILMASPDDISIADLSGRLLMFSDAATTMFGYDREEGPGMTIMDFIVPEDHEVARANMMKMVQQGHSGPNEYRAIRKDRSCFDIEVNSALIRDRQGKPFRMVLIARDITHRKKADQKIQELVRELEIERDLAQRNSLTDSLTGLLNRRYFDTALQAEFSRHKRTGSHLSLIMIDVDYFKKYNDYYGHLQGDDCLRQIARALKTSIERCTDLVTRYGGEEFAVILPDTNSQGALVLSERITKAVLALNLPHADSDISESVTLSMGIASAADQDLATASQLVELADQAMYRAKKNGRNRCEVFIPGLA